MNERQNPVRQVVGIDISKDKFDVCLTVRYEGLTDIVLFTGEFDNTASGISNFYKKIQSKQVVKCPIWYVMEATGVYYEELAWMLHNQQEQVSVVQPNKIKQFSKSLDVRSKTDRIDAKSISRYGLERNLTRWNAPSTLIWLIKMLCRERQDIVGLRSKCLNRKHAYNHTHIYDDEGFKFISKRNESRIEFYNNQINEIEQQMITLARQDEKLWTIICKISQVKGLKELTILTVIAEANGFVNITSIRQLVAYVGLDIRMNQSGRFMGRSTITKKGNSQIRSALYMPAMAARRFNPTYKAYYSRLYEKNGTPKKSLMGVMRKLLVLIYVLYKNDTEYDPGYTHHSTRKKPISNDETLQKRKPELSVLQTRNTYKKASKPVETKPSKKDNCKDKNQKDIIKEEGAVKHPSSVDESPLKVSAETLCFAEQS